MKLLQLSLFLCLSQLLFAQTPEKGKKAAQPALRFTVLEIERQNIPYGSEDLFVFEFKNTSKKTKELIVFLKTENDFKNFRKKTRFWFYDLLMLDVLSTHNHLGSKLFSKYYHFQVVWTFFKVPQSCC